MAALVNAEDHILLGAGSSLCTTALCVAPNVGVSHTRGFAPR
jgi:hypothetical protein